MALIHSLRSLPVDVLLMSKAPFYFVGKDSFILAGFNRSGLEIARVKFSIIKQDRNPLGEESLKALFVEGGGLLNKLPKGLLEPQPLSEIELFMQDGQHEVHIAPVNDTLFPHVWLEPYPLNKGKLSRPGNSLSE